MKTRINFENNSNPKKCFERNHLNRFSYNFNRKRLLRAKVIKNPHNTLHKPLAATGTGILPVLCANLKGTEIIFYTSGWKAYRIATNCSSEAASICGCSDMLGRDVSPVSDWQGGRRSDGLSAFPEGSVPRALIWELLKTKQQSQSLLFLPASPACSW